MKSGVSLRVFQPPPPHAKSLSRITQHTAVTSRQLCTPSGPRLAVQRRSRPSGLNAQPTSPRRDATPGTEQRTFPPTHPEPALHIEHGLRVDIDDREVVLLSALSGPCVATRRQGHAQEQGGRTNDSRRWRVT